MQSFDRLGTNRCLPALALLLAACSSQPDDPGAVTADEARQLNEAAAMLDANSVDANALDADDSDRDNEVTE